MKFKFFKKKRGQAMMDYALIVVLVAVCVMSTLTHIGDLSNNSFDILSNTFENAQKAYEQELLSLQNNRTIQEYAAVAGGTASADIAQSWAGSTVYGQDNIGSPGDSSNPNSGNLVDGNGNINNPPIANFAFYNDIKPALGKNFQLLNTSYDEDGDRIAKAEWSGVPSESKFKSAGTYTIRLRVADEHGAWSDWYEETFIVENQNPIAVITKSTEFLVLDEEDKDLAVDGYGYYLTGEHNKNLQLFDTASYDPDGHILKYSHWVSTISGIENVSKNNFGDGLNISQSKSGPVYISLTVEDEFEGKSEPATTAFYYFASQRPEIRNITFSDGSNGLNKLETITDNDWITEIYPYTGSNELQIPVSAYDTRISFKVSDDSNAITHYQYKFNGSLSDFIPLDVVEKNDGMFDLADLTKDFSTKNGSAILNFRVCDESETCSRWTEDIPVIFKSISDVNPLIKSFTIENYSTYDETPIETQDNNFYAGTFRATIDIDDMYGNMRTIDSLYLYLNNTELQYYDLTKITGTKYVFYFDINEEMTDANLTVKGVYDSLDETDRAEIDGFNVYKYVLTITNAEMYNPNIEDWWNVDLTKVGSTETNVISGIKPDKTNGEYAIKVIYNSAFNAPIDAVSVDFIKPDGSFGGRTTSLGPSIQKISNQEILINVTANYVDNNITAGSNRMKISLIDELGNVSNYSCEEGTFVAVMNYDSYTPTLTNYAIKDIEGTEGNTDKTYSRGVIDITYTIEDFFYIIRNLDKTQGADQTILNEDTTNLIVEKSDTEVTNNSIIKQVHTIDTHNWSAWETTSTPTISAEVSYLNEYTFAQLDINLNNYNPHAIIGLDYAAHKQGGLYTIHFRPAKYKDYFEIDTIVLDIYLDDEVVIKEFSFADVLYNETNDQSYTIAIIGDRLPSRKTTKVEAQFTHTNNVADSNKFSNYLTVEKPYEIEVVDMEEHREPSTTTNGYTKLFADLDVVTTSENSEIFETIDLEETDRNHRVNIRMYPDKGVAGEAVVPYATYDHITLTPQGTIIFANRHILENDNYYINGRNTDNATNSVTDDSYGHDIYTIFSGDVAYDNTPGSGSGIYYKKNIHYLDTLETTSATSTTIKYINMCTTSDWDFNTRTCLGEPFSIEATLYDNGAMRVHYGNIPFETDLDSIVGGKINVETSDIYFATAYGQYTMIDTLAHRTLRFNKLPSYYIIPPTITDILYKQSESTTKQTIDEVTSETILAEYTIIYDNPDNVEILAQEGSLTQYQYNNLTGSYSNYSSQITLDGPATNSGTHYVFESPTVIRRATSKATIKFRFKYSDDPLYYSAWFEKDNFKYVGPIIINFTTTTPTHVEPTKDIDGYIPIDFTAGDLGNCYMWAADSNEYYDDCSSDLIPLGFEMAYINGERVNSVSVSTNSLIRFDQIVQTGYNAQPVTGLEDDTLAVLWYDQDFQRTSTDPNSPAGIFYKQFLDEPIPYTSIKYIEMTAYSAGAEPWDYEVQIYQDGKIIVHYSKEVPVKMTENSETKEYTIPNTTVAFKKTMLMGYGSLVVPDSGELDEQMDFVSQRKLQGSVNDPNSYVNQDTIGRSIQINLNQCNLGEGNCGIYTPPVKNPNDIIYNCTQSTQTVNLAAGTYKLQLWGASGSNGLSAIGGKGGYAEGTVRFETPTTLYVNVGCQGKDNQGGWNGGGTVRFDEMYDDWSGMEYGVGGGGGASDIRIGENLLAYRMIVAGGGGGAYDTTPGGAGGGLQGMSNNAENDGLGAVNDGSHMYTSDESTLAYSGSFGHGGAQIGNSENTSGGAGGGGYYGGNAGTSRGSGGGGSGYVYESTSVANPVLLAGNEQMPTTDHSGTKIGQNGNGYVIITSLENDTSIPAFNISNFTNAKNNLNTLYPTYNNFNVGEVKEYYSENQAKHLILDPGTYKLQVWGARGGGSGSSYYGKGGYSTGLLTLDEVTDAYIYVGNTGSYSSSGGSTGGWNGGGSTAIAKSGSGGGATDIRLYYDSLSNRVIVAGGGGGAPASVKGGAGGGLQGGDGTGGQHNGIGGTQDMNGFTVDVLDSFNGCVGIGALGQGANNTCTGTNFTAGGAGGGGYYGGGSGINGASGGGGSGYINEKLKNATTISGTETMPTTYGTGTETGHSNSGYAIITKISDNTNEPITIDSFADFKIGEVKDYICTSETETLTLDPGYYKLQLWGAQGGGTTTYPGGKGGYAESIIEITTPTEAYVNTGCAGSYSNSAPSEGGWNGGGTGATYGGSGGGASDIRIGGNELQDRIIVAGGGGGSGEKNSYHGLGGAGGGLKGLDGTSSYNTSYAGHGGSQIEENSTVLGLGGSNTNTATSNSKVSAGGGGGYYGGTAGKKYAAAGGGGSSYISPLNITGLTISGDNEMPSPTSVNGVQIGNTNNGHVKITRINNSEVNKYITGYSKTLSQTGITYVETLPAGTYKLELWGGSGGNSTDTSYLGGAGGYVTGNYTIDTPTQIYVTIGGKGENATTESRLSVGGTNGGGTGATKSGAGGGATDIRINGITLENRILVAGGGGGASYYSSSYAGSGGAGGGLEGLNATSLKTSYTGKGGTQTKGGSYSSAGSYSEKGSLGLGGNATRTTSSYSTIAGGGGAGYYGGASGGGRAAGGGGGSSYYDTSVLTSTETLDGTMLQPSPTNNGTQTGNIGNGYAKITKIN